MKDLGAMHYCLGRFEVKRDRKNRKIWISQKKYIENIFNEFGMETCKAVKTPFQVGVKLSIEMCPKAHEKKKYTTRLTYVILVGSLMCAMVCTRPNITHLVGVVSIFMFDLGKEHWMVVKRIFRYLQGTKDLNICKAIRTMPYITRVVEMTFFVFMDFFMHIGDQYVDKGKPISAYIFTLFGGELRWMSTRRSIIAIFSLQVE
jgi:hypothetical protein